MASRDEELVARMAARAGLSLEEFYVRAPAVEQLALLWLEANGREGRIAYDREEPVLSGSDEQRREWQAFLRWFSARCAAEGGS